MTTTEATKTRPNKPIISGPIEKSPLRMEVDPQKLIQRVESEPTLREFVQACKDAIAVGNVYPKKRLSIMIHQDGFAPRYEPKEMQLLAMALKYAGLFGIGVGVIGKNGETLDKS